MDQGYNCTSIDAYSDFLLQDGSIAEAKANFIDQIYLSQAGIRSLRALWLRHFGYFPEKVSHK